MALTLIPKNEAARLFLADHPEYTEASLIRVYRDTDTLRSDLDALAVRLDALLRERAAIIDTLRTFYRSELSTSSVQAILQLAVALDPTLAQAEQLRLTESE